MRIIVVVEIPDNRVQDLCQHLRNFDVTNPGCKFNIFAHAPNKSVEEIARDLDIDPPLQFKRELRIMDDE